MLTKLPFSVVREGEVSETAKCLLLYSFRALNTLLCQFSRDKTIFLSIMQCGNLHINRAVEQQKVDRRKVKNSTFHSKQTFQDESEWSLIKTNFFMWTLWFPGSRHFSNWSVFQMADMFSMLDAIILYICHSFYSLFLHFECCRIDKWKRQICHKICRNMQSQHHKFWNCSNIWRECWLEKWEKRHIKETKHEDFEIEREKIYTEKKKTNSQTNIANGRSFKLDFMAAEKNWNVLLRSEWFTCSKAHEPNK